MTLLRQQNDPISNSFKGGDSHTEENNIFFNTVNVDSAEPASESDLANHTDPQMQRAE